MSGFISPNPPLFGATPSPVLQQLFNTIRIRAAGITDEQMQLELVQGMYDFFTESLVWRDDKVVAVTTQTATYSVAGWATGGEVIFPTLVKFNDIGLAPVAGMSDTTAADVATPQVFTYAPDMVITLGPQINSNGGKLHVYVALRPQLTAPVVPDVYIAQWFDGLLDTVLARLYMIPAKPWSNANLGALHAKKSRAQMSKARDTAKRGFAGGASPWRYPYFAKGSGANMWGWGGGVSTR